MRPITDKYKISREKLAYIIDSTAAPICIIAPVSSWAAAVGSNLKATNTLIQILQLSVQPFHGTSMHCSAFC